MAVENRSCFLLFCLRPLLQAICKPSARPRKGTGQLRLPGYQQRLMPKAARRARLGDPNSQGIGAVDLVAVCSRLRHGAGAGAAKGARICLCLQKQARMRTGQSRTCLVLPHAQVLVELNRCTLLMANTLQRVRHSTNSRARQTYTTDAITGSAVSTTSPT